MKPFKYTLNNGDLSNKTTGRPEGDSSSDINENLNNI